MDHEIFEKKWKHSTRTEKSAAHEHFLDLCELLEVEKPAEVDPEGKFYTFEKHVPKTGGKSGFVDVWRKGHFAWEYKRSYKGEFNHKNLVKAYAQVKQYADALENPPLLIVSDMKEIRIHTNFTNTVSEQHVFQLPDINDPEVRRTLRWCFLDPEKLRPEITRESVTEKAAMALGAIAAKLHRKYEPRRVAHFLNKLVFCLFAEDIGLLPDKVFADILEEGLKNEAAFPDMLRDLFRAMKDKNGRFGLLTIPWFNGGLFDDDDVLPLGFFEIRDLVNAARLDWGAIEPAIFGTLFEGGLNPEKRKLMASLFDAHGVDEDKASLPGILAAPAADKGVGIHYTDPGTIMKIVEPVVLAPLRREWEDVKQAIAKKRAAKTKAKSEAGRTRAESEAREIYFKFRKRLGDFRVLDPACGSGNFLYLALQHLKDFDLKMMEEAKKLGLPFDDQRVGPDAVLGLEINPYAAELARVTIWIGELQWQMRYAFGVSRTPILGQLKGIVNKDALVTTDGSEATWPLANAVIGNPPFLGANKFKRELGEDYTRKLRSCFDGKVRKTTDLVMYWFYKSSQLINKNSELLVGLVATSAIRTGNNLKDLKEILLSRRIFCAWSDLPWLNDGVNPRVAVVCFASADRVPTRSISLDGNKAPVINPDLTSLTGADLSIANRLTENTGIIFQGSKKIGKFEVGYERAKKWLQLPLNPNDKSNSFVLRPSWLTSDMNMRPRDKWIVDFGLEMSESEAALFEAPFEYVKENVYPQRIKNPRKARREKWWRHGDPQPKMRAAILNLSRYLVTPEVTQQRIFVWAEPKILPDCKLMVVARDDNVTFGILHSRIHRIWAHSKGGVRGNSRTYTPDTVFETFPFPDGLTPNMPADDYAGDPRAETIAKAAQQLNELRENWLNPPDLVKQVPEVVEGYPDRILPKNEKAAAELKKRTLTNLYNTRPAWLDNAHKAMDAAVAAAYGWPEDLSDDEVLKRLFALNQDRAKAGSKKKGRPEKKKKKRKNKK